MSRLQSFGTFQEYLEEKKRKAGKTPPVAKEGEGTKIKTKGQPLSLEDELIHRVDTQWKKFKALSSVAIAKEHYAEKWSEKKAIRIINKELDRLKEANLRYIKKSDGIWWKLGTITEDKDYIRINFVQEKIEKE